MRVRTRLFVVLLVVSAAANILLVAYLLFVNEMETLSESVANLTKNWYGDGKVLTLWIPGSIAVTFFALFLVNAIKVIGKQRKKTKGDASEELRKDLRGLIPLAIEIFTSGKGPAIVCVSAFTIYSIQWHVASSFESIKQFEIGLSEIELAKESLSNAADTIAKDVDELYGEDIVERIGRSTADIETLATEISELYMRIGSLTRELERLIEYTDDLEHRVDDAVDGVEDLSQTLVDLEEIVSWLNATVNNFFDFHPLLRRLSPDEGVIPE